MFAVQLDPFDNQVKGIHAVDFARHAIGAAWDGAKAFGNFPRGAPTSTRLPAFTVS